jgi:hypothetical protein
MALPKAGLLFQHYLPETYKNNRYVWFYLMKHSIAHNIQRPVTGSLTNNSLSRMRKEAVVALLRNYPAICLEGMKETFFTLPVERRTVKIPNKKQFMVATIP